MGSDSGLRRPPERSPALSATEETAVVAESESMVPRSGGGGRFRAVENCVDYRSYVFPLDTGITKATHCALQARLRALGKADEERLGVLYIRGYWGFLVFPPRGFPELRVSFYKETDESAERTILNTISEAFQHDFHT